MHKSSRTPILIVFFLTLVFAFSDGVSLLPEILQRNLLVESLTIQEAKAAVVNAVQSGTATSPGGSCPGPTGCTTLVAISPAVDPTRSFLIFQTRHNSNRPPGSMIRGRIDSTRDNVEFVRVTDGVAPEPVTINIRWYVVEFSSGVSVQRGEIDGSAPINVPITAVASMDQAFVTWSKTPHFAAGSFGGDDPILGELTSTTNLQFRVNTGAISHIIWWHRVHRCCGHPCSKGFYLTNRRGPIHHGHLR